MHTVLKHIHDTLLRKRESPYLVKKLRDELVAPPYGIPACNLAVFAAVAVRHEIPRLRWQNTKESSFAKNLTNAFDESSKVTIRLSEFSTKQFAMLFAVGRCFQVPEKAIQTRDEREASATNCSYRLRDFVKGQAETVKSSPKLQDKTRDLVKIFNNPFNTTQDVAESLIALLGVERESLGDIGSKSEQLLKELLADFAKVEDAKRHEIEQSWQDFMPQDEAAKADLMDRLSHDRSSPVAKKVAVLMNDAANVKANNLTLTLLNKLFDQCSDSDIGQCKGQLSMLVDYHPPIPPPPITSVIAPIPPAVHEPAPVTSDNLIHVLREKIDAAKLPNATIQDTLQQLLNHYKDA